MLRAVSHASLLFLVGHTPGGPRAYHAVTRGLLGSQRRVLAKLRRVWPGYVGIWRDRCGLTLEGCRVWVHEPGWTPFAAAASFLLTGRGGLLTCTGDPPSRRYVAAATLAALGAAFEGVPAARRRALETLGPGAALGDLSTVTGARVAAGVSVEAIPAPDASVDLCHSGGVLEHEAPARLAAFLRESFRVLRPGGVVSHVFDHRDHLRHVDPSWPFLLHMALPARVHRALCGHPLLAHNRLAPAEVEALFREAGFERLAARRFILPDKRYVDDDAQVFRGEPGVPRWLRTGRLRALSPADRHTAAVHYLYRKPGGPR
jgi:SAM-dependent methyltransferase